MTAFSPLTRQSLSEGVFDQIVDQIIAGQLPNGDALPSERELAEAFGVSRPAVREALKRLAQGGMITIRQGESTTVQPWRRTAGPDLLARLLLRPDGSIDLVVARSILEVRRAVGPDIAALAAEHAAGNDELEHRLEKAIGRLSQTHDAIELQWAALDFWDVVVDGSNNVAYRLMTNTLTAAYTPLLAGMATVMLPEVSNLDGYRKLARAITGGDKDTARARAHDLLEAGTGTVLEAITALLGHQEMDS